MPYIRIDSRPLSPSLLIEGECRNRRVPGAASTVWARLGKEAQKFVVGYRRGVAMQRVLVPP